MTARDSHSDSTRTSIAYPVERDRRPVKETREPRHKSGDARRVIDCDANFDHRVLPAGSFTVEAWLEEDGVESATLSLGDSSYTLVNSSPLTASP
jgi:hypothetical protein